MRSVYLASQVSETAPRCQACAAVRSENMKGAFGAAVPLGAPLCPASSPVVPFGESVGQATMMDHFFGFSSLRSTFHILFLTFPGVEEKPL